MLNRRTRTSRSHQESGCIRQNRAVQDWWCRSLILPCSTSAYRRRIHLAEPVSVLRNVEIWGALHEQWSISIDATDPEQLSKCNATSRSSKNAPFRTKCLRKGITTLCCQLLLQNLIRNQVTINSVTNLRNGTVLYKADSTKILQITYFCIVANTSDDGTVTSFTTWSRDWLRWSDVSDRSKKIGALLWSKVLR